MSEFEKEDFNDEFPSPKWKKPIVLVIGIFFLLMTLSLLVFNTPIGGIVQGLPAKISVENNTLTHPSVKVIFENETLKELNALYAKEQEHEFPACLKGTIQNNTYFIEEFYIPRIIDRSYGHVHFESCQESIIMLHSHPYNHCGASDTDLNTLNAIKQVNPKTIMLIMCKEDAFSVYV